MLGENREESSKDQQKSKLLLVHRLYNRTATILCFHKAFQNNLSLGEIKKTTPIIQQVFQIGLFSFMLS